MQNAIQPATSIAYLAISVRIVNVLLIGWFVQMIWAIYNQGKESLAPNSLPQFLMIILFVGVSTLLLTSWWVYQIHRNAQKTGLVTISNKAGAMFWSHFLPVMNLFFPAMVTVEAFRAVAKLNSFAPDTKPTPPSTVWPILWWVLRVLALPMAGLTLVFIMNMTGNFQVNVLLTLTLGTFGLSHLAAIVMMWKGMRREVAYLKLWNQGILQQAATLRPTL
jgi:hypothetical protein